MHAQINLRRIALLGDPHIGKNDRPQWQEIVDDINALDTDAVFLLGDLTDHGDSASLAAAVDLFNRFSAPWRTVIGNHDLKSDEHDTDEAAVLSFLQHVGQQTPWFRVDIEPMMILGLSNTYCRENPFTPNEIVIDQEQIAWCRRQLTDNPNLPAIVICHTPPMGSDLLTLPEFQGIGGSAYVNQQHRPGDIQQLIRDNPNILIWCSSHSHLGQHYTDALQQRLGVHFVHVGMASRRKSRDGRRHSRIIDFDERQFIIRTFDHATRQLDETKDYTPHLSMDELVAQRKWSKPKRVAPRHSGMSDNGTAYINRLEVTRFAFVNLNAILSMEKIQQERMIDWCREQCWEYAVDEMIISQASGEIMDAMRLSKFYLDDLPMSYISPKNDEQTQQPWGEFQIRYVEGQMPSITSPDEPIILWKTDNRIKFSDVQLPKGREKVFTVFTNVCPGYVEIIDHGDVTFNWIWPVDADTYTSPAPSPDRAGAESGIRQWPISNILKIIDWNKKSQKLLFPNGENRFG